MWIGGGNDNVVRNNYVFDNWLRRVMLFGVPAAFRDDNDPAHAEDTSHRNRFTGNRMGVTPSGKLAPNGVDSWWDQEGSGNCWQNNDGGPEGITADPPPAAGPSDLAPAFLPDCSVPQPPEPGFQPPNLSKAVELVACSQWTRDNRHPPGCPWFDTPPRPTGGQPTVAPYVVPTASPAAEPLSFLTQTFRYCFAVARTGGSLQYLFGRTRSETHA